MTSEKTPVQAEAASRLVLELVGQKAPPDFWDELKKRARKFAKRWAIRLGGACAFVGSNILSYHAGKGTDLTDIYNLGAFAAVVVVVFIVFNKFK